MQQSRGQQEGARLQTATNAYIERIRSVPANLLDREPEPGEWTLMQLTAHAAEIFPYWAKQMTWVRQHPGQPFGRTAADQSRIQYVEDHKTDPLDSLIATIQNGSEEAARALGAFSDEEWTTVTGIHAVRGEMTLDAMSELFLAGHAEEHLKQLNETLDKLNH